VRLPTIDLLNQTEVWYDVDGARFVLKELDNESIITLRGWLFLNAHNLYIVQLLDLRIAARTRYDTAAQYMADFAVAAHQGLHPLYWMEQRPLFQAIDRIINERRSYVYVRILKEAGRT
jgi:hypothetical protein